MHKEEDRLHTIEPCVLGGGKEQLMHRETCTARETCVEIGPYMEDACQQAGFRLIRKGAIECKYAWALQSVF